MNTKKSTTEEDDDYVSFVVYLRKNNVWKVVGDVFQLLYETNPEDPIEANVNAENSDNRAVEQMRRKVEEAENKLTTLKRDKYVLMTKLNSLDEDIREHLQETNQSFQRTDDVVDYTEDNDMAAETFLSDSKHVDE